MFDVQQSKGSPDYSQKKLYRTLTLISFSKLSQDENDELVTLITTADLSDLWLLAEEHALGVRLQKKLSELLPPRHHEQKSAMPPASRQKVELCHKRAHKHLQRAEAQFVQTQELLSLAQKEGIPVILLKGGALGVGLYNDPTYKKMNDVDVLILAKDIDHFAKLCLSMGFKQLGQLFNQRELDLEKNHHLSPFVSADLQCIIGVHWQLASPFARWKPGLEELWQRAVPINYGTSTALRLGWEHMLGHICLHLPFYKLGLRELADAYNIIRDCEVDWSYFSEIMSRWKIESAVYRVLQISCKVSGIKVPEFVLANARSAADPLTIRDTEVRLLDSYRLYHSRSLHIGRIEKSFVYFRTTENLGERTRALTYMWINTLYPPVSEIGNLLAMSATAESTMSHGKISLLRLKAGKRVLTAMARDYGGVALTYLTLSNLLLWWRTLILSAFGQSGEKCSREILQIREALE